MANSENLNIKDLIDQLPKKEGGPAERLQEELARSWRQPCPWDKSQECVCTNDQGPTECYVSFNPVMKVDKTIALTTFSPENR